MSQPVGIIAKIEIGADAYKNYLRSKPIKALAEAMFSVIKNQSQDFYLFTYNKKEEILDIFIYYHYGNSETLKSEDFEVIQSIEPFLNSSHRGYLIGTYDSANWDDQSAFMYSYILENGKWIELKKMDAGILKQIEKDTDAFFEKMDAPFSDKVFSSQIVDSSIVKKISKLQEDDRVKNLINRLDEATITQPLFFFHDYYYNGNCLYTTSGKALKQIDVRTFVQKPYGATDGQFVVLDDHVLNCKPENFKKLQKCETQYYIFNHQVYDWKLEPLDGADPNTFKLLSEEVATDKNFVYFRYIPIPRTQAGNYKILELNINSSIFIGENIIYFNWKKLNAIDPPTFQFEEIISLETPYCFCFAAKDNQGEFLYVDAHPYSDNTEPEIIRGYNDETIKHLIDTYSLQKNHKSEKEEIIDSVDSADFQKRYAEKPYDDYLLRTINDYCAYRFENWKKSHGKAELEQILALYDLIKESAWANPSIFHHIACTQAALDQREKATEAVRNAFVFGYEHMDLIWKDEDLKSLHNDANFLNLKKVYQQQIQFSETPVVNLDVLNKLNSVQQLEAATATQIVKRFLLSDKKHIQEMADRNQQITPDFWEKYLNQLSSFYTYFFSSPSNVQQMHIYDPTFYQRFADYELIPTMLHLNEMDYQFRQAASFVQTMLPKAYKECLICLEKLKKSLRSVTDKDRRESLIETINQSDIMIILGEKINPKDYEN